VPCRPSAQQLYTSEGSQAIILPTGFKDAIALADISTSDESRYRAHACCCRPPARLPPARSAPSIVAAQHPGGAKLALQRAARATHHPPAAVGACAPRPVHWLSVVSERTVRVLRVLQAFLDQAPGFSMSRFPSAGSQDVLVSLPTFVRCVCARAQ
jgi:hypothetical protein